MSRKKIRLFSFFIGLLSFLALGMSAESRAAGVSLSAVPTSQTVTVGQTATYTIKINRDNYADKVTLSATGLPSGVSAVFTPNMTTATSSTLKLQTAASTPVGTFNISVKGTANGISIAPIIVKLVTNPVPSISLTVTPSSRSIVVGQSTFYDIAIKRINYDGELTLSAENVPTGVTVYFDPETTFGNSSRMYLYSNGLPFASQSFSMYVRARNPYDGIENLQLVQLHANYNISWAAQFEAPADGTRYGDFATDVTYDSASNVYVTGYTYDTGAADFHSWVAKYDPLGNQLWLRTIRNLIEDRSSDIYVDASGNVYVAGSTRGRNLDIFVAKYDANGALLAPVSTFGTANEEGRSGMQFGVNSAGSTTLTAATRVRRVNGQRDSINQPTVFVEYDVTRYVFDANFNRTGTTLVTDADGEPRDLTIGADNSVYVLCEDSTRISDGFVKTVSLIEKFNGPNGANYQSQLIGLNESGSWFASRLKADAGGSVVAVGSNQIYGANSNLNYSYTWTVKLNSLGALAWRSSLFSGHPQTTVNSIEMDESGNYFIAGLTWGSLRGTNPESGEPNDAMARTDAWFGKYSGTNGDQIYLSQFNVNDHDGFNAIKFKPGGTLYFAGYSLNFRTNFGFQDALLIRCSQVFCGFVQ